MHNTDSRRAIIFDLDGTLLNTLADLQASLNHALTAYGYPQQGLEQVRQRVGNGVAVLLARSLPEGAETANFEQIRQLFRSHYQANCSQQTKPYAGIPELLDELLAKGYRLGVASNKPDAVVKELVEHYFPAKIHYAAGEKAGQPRKPAPDMLYEVLENLGCSKQQGIYVGDSETDVAAAANARLPLIAVSWGFRDLAQLQAAGAQKIVANVAEFMTALAELAPSNK